MIARLLCECDKRHTRANQQIVNQIAHKVFLSSHTMQNKHVQTTTRKS